MVRTSNKKGGSSSINSAQAFVINPVEKSEFMECDSCGNSFDHPDAVSWIADTSRCHECLYQDGHNLGKVGEHLADMEVRRINDEISLGAEGREYSIEYM